jgi:hypothetical protein
MPDHIEAPGREPGDCGSLGHPAIHATPLSRVRDAFQPNHIRWYATSQSPGSRRGLVWPPVGCRPIRGSRRVSATAVAGSGGSLANAGSDRSPWARARGLRVVGPPRHPCHPAFPGARRVSAEPRLLVRHVAVPRLAPRACMAACRVPTDQRIPPCVRHGVMCEGWSRNQIRSHSSVMARRSSEV